MCDGSGHPARDFLYRWSFCRGCTGWRDRVGIALDTLGKMLAGIDVDYADIRYEVKRENRIRLENGVVKEFSSCATDGFLLRVLQGGGLASVAFIRPEQAAEAIRRATANAVFLGSRRAKPIRFAPVPVVRARVAACLDQDPRTIDGERKLEPDFRQ